MIEELDRRVCLSKKTYVLIENGFFAEIGSKGFGVCVL